ncbi:MAG: glycosyltransferase family 39 protein, partial [bacterium]|nr:glycosyltransferase family 39 protein [bacterium]
RVAGVFSGVAAGGAGYVAYLCGVAFVELGMLFFGMLALAAFIRAIDPARPEGETGRYVMAAGLLAGLAVGCKYTALVLIALPLGLALVIRYLPNRRRRYRTPLLFTAGVLAAFSPWLVKNAVMTGNPVFPLANAVFRATPPGWGMEQSDHFAECHSLAPEDRSASNRLALLWEHVFGDEWQRFGPPVFVLALIALVVGGRGHGRIEWYCLVILAVQVAVWLSATHLYARFAVPFLLPLVVLAGRSIEAAWAWRGRGLLAVVLLVGLGFNLDHLAKLYRQHLYVDGRKIPLEGATGFFTNGMGLGHEHLAVVNHELPESARILMLGDAKAFYFRRAVDYHVVFNRHPFVEMLRAGASPAEALQWLRDRAYSHVLVNWPEIKRLRQSRYGFPEEINPELFRRLAPAGLVHQRTILTASSGVPYADLFTVPSPH